MKLLALDLGTQCGWALLASGVVSSGSVRFRQLRGEGDGMRFVRFRRWLCEIKGGSGLDAVYFEAVHRHLGTDAAHMYGGFHAVMAAWCETQEPRLIYIGVEPGTIKKSWTGNGAAKKPLMIRQAHLRGHQPIDDNEADALALLDYAQHAQMKKAA